MKTKKRILVLMTLCYGLLFLVSCYTDDTELDNHDVVESNFISGNPSRMFWKYSAEKDYDAMLSQANYSGIWGREFECDGEAFCSQRTYFSANPFVSPGEGDSRFIFPTMEVEASIGDTVYFTAQAEHEVIPEWKSSVLSSLKTELRFEAPDFLSQSITYVPLLSRQVQYLTLSEHAASPDKPISIDYLTLRVPVFLDPQIFLPLYRSGQRQFSLSLQGGLATQGLENIRGKEHPYWKIFGDRKAPLKLDWFFGVDITLIVTADDEAFTDPILLDAGMEPVDPLKNTVDELFTISVDAASLSSSNKINRVLAFYDQYEDHDGVLHFLEAPQILLDETMNPVLEVDIDQEIQYMPAFGAQVARFPLKFIVFNQAGASVEKVSDISFERLAMPYFEFLQPNSGSSVAYSDFDEVSFRFDLVTQKEQNFPVKVVVTELGIGNEGDKVIYTWDRQGGESEELIQFPISQQSIDQIRFSPNKANNGYAQSFRFCVITNFGFEECTEITINVDEAGE